VTGGGTTGRRTGRRLPAARGAALPAGRPAATAPTGAAVRRWLPGVPGVRTGASATTGRGLAAAARRRARRLRPN